MHAEVAAKFPPFPAQKRRGNQIPHTKFRQVLLQYLNRGCLHGGNEEGYMNLFVMGDVQNREYDDSEGPHGCESYGQRATKDINPDSTFSYVALGI
jgi:hypothetical protein